MVAPRVYAAMSQPLVGTPGSLLFQTVEEVRTLLGMVYSTANTFNIAVSGTGTSGMEAAVANFVEPGTKFALLTNGFFADRIGEMARRQGGEVVRLATGWAPRSITTRCANSFAASGRPWSASYKPKLPPDCIIRPNPSARPRTKWTRWSLRTA